MVNWRTLYLPVKRHEQVLLTLALSLGFFVHYITPLWDIDFWWHAAMGRAILELGRLPDVDPLGIYQESSLRASVLLKAYWLSQMLYQWILNTCGVNGIVWLRATILSCALGITIWRALRLGANPLWTGVVVLCTGFTLLHYTADRPAIFSFFWLTVMLLLVESAPTHRGIRLSMALALLMAVWVNMHGGASLGALVLVLLAAVMFAEKYLPGKPRNENTQKWGFLLLAAALATLISPNDWDLYRLLWLFEGSEMQSRTSEYLSPWSVTKQMSIALPGYWLLALLALPAGYALLKQRDYQALSITLLLLALSLSAFRYVPFFMLGASPLIARGLESIFPGERLSSNTQRVAAILFTLGGIVSLLFAFTNASEVRAGIDQQRFPVRALEFLNTHPAVANPKIFNHFNWGGYLAYNADNDVQIYIDGRNLEAGKFLNYTHILWATDYGRRWLDAGAFDLVISPEYSPLGRERYAIIGYLEQNPSWAEIYRDETARIFMHRHANPAHDQHL